MKRIPARVLYLEVSVSEEKKRKKIYLGMFFFATQPRAAMTSGGAWTSSIRTPSPDNGNSSFPFGWMKVTS